LVGTPLVKLGVLRSFADDGVLDDRIAEVVDHRSDGEHATQSFVQARLCHARPLLLVPRAAAGCRGSGGSTCGTCTRFRLGRAGGGTLGCPGGRSGSSFVLGLTDVV